MLLINLYIDSENYNITYHKVIHWLRLESVKKILLVLKDDDIATPL